MSVKFANGSSSDGTSSKHAHSLARSVLMSILDSTSAPMLFLLYVSIGVGLHFPWSRFVIFSMVFVW